MTVEEVIKKLSKKRLDLEVILVFGDTDDPSYAEIDRIAVEEIPQNAIARASGEAKTDALFIYAEVD